MTIKHFAISALASAALFCGHAQAATEWAQYQGNAQHTGYLDVALDSVFTFAWSKDLGAVNPVAAADGLVFVSTQGYFDHQQLYALDAATGQELWSKNFGSIFSVNPPSYANGTVYLQTGNHSGDSWFRGYDVQTGELKVKAPFAAQWERYDAPTLYNGNAYVDAGHLGGGAWSYDLSTGDMRWSVDLGGHDGWTPAVSDRYVVAKNGGTVYVLDPGTGAVQKTIQDPNFSWSGWDEISSPVLAGDHAFTVSYGNSSTYLASFDLEAGTLDWSLSGVTSQIATDGSEIFAIRNGALASIDLETGAVNWMWEEASESSFVGEVLATRNFVLVSGQTGIYVIDRKTHKTVTKLAATGSMALGNDQLVVSTSTGLKVFNVAAVPEPASVILTLLGLGASVVVAARRKRA